jgi:hypothetical protein
LTHKENDRSESNCGNVRRRTARGRASERRAGELSEKSRQQKEWLQEEGCKKE